MFDPEEFGAAMGELVREAVAPLQQKIAALEKQLSERPDVAKLIADEVAKQVKAIPPAKDGKDGKDADMVHLMENMGARIRAAVYELPKPADGKSITLEEVRPLIESSVKAAVDALPKPADGKNGVDGKDGINGKDGTSITIADIQPEIDAAAKAVINAIPTPKDGRDGIDGKDGANGKDGRDGQDGKSFTLDDAKALLEHHWSAWELDFERRAASALEKAVDRLPKPRDGKDGKNGADGRDGIGFDDLSFEFDGERTVTLKFQRGDVIKTFDLTFPVIIDRGVYRDGMECQPGDGVTWAGSYWIAQRSTKAKPDSPDSGFRLAVKRGRDGKDGRDGIDKEPIVKLKD